MESFAPPPSDDQLTDRSFRMGWKWLQWLVAFVTRVDETPRRLARVALTAQEASIATTPFALGAQPAGLFRVTWYMRVTRAAGTSSSMTVTIGSTDGLAVTQSGAAMTGNTTTTVQSGTFLVKADRALLPTYAVAYASVGVPTAQYSFDAIVEGVT